MKNPFDKLTLTEAYSKYRISRLTIRNWALTGILPYERNPKQRNQYEFFESDLLEIMEGRNYCTQPRTKRVN
jgi:predicted site-specific integrase-resolvase